MSLMSPLFAQRLFKKISRPFQLRPQPSTALLDLPNELLLLIAEQLQHPKAVNALLLTNRRFAALLAPLLHRHAITLPILDMEPPVNWAVRKGHLGLLKLLAENGADLNATLCEFGWAPLHFAILMQRDAEVRLLIELGADATVRDSRGNNLLIFASRWDNEGILRLLLAKGEIDIDAEDSENRTALHRAVSEARLKATQLLLKIGAGINVTDRSGQTALHVAVEGDQVQIVDVLLKAGADLTIRDEHGMTPLHCAVTHVRRKVMGRLVDAMVAQGIDVDFRTGDGRSALHLASVRGSLGAVKSLLKAGAGVSIQDTIGMTPLHYAVLNGRQRIVRKLLDARASTTIKDRWGKTPVDRAMCLRPSDSYIEITLLLRGYRSMISLYYWDGSEI